MIGLRKWLYSLHPYLLTLIASILTAAQIILASLMRGFSSVTVQWIGWITLWSAAFFGVVPIITFRRKGGVPEGKTYIHTTVLVDSGIYAVVRHPQNGTAWLMINLGIMLVTWHWTVAVLGLASMVLAYADTFNADQYCLEKFGEAYQHYMERVPRVNFWVGIIKLGLNLGRGEGSGKIHCK